MLGIGEIGLNKNTRNEMKVLEQHVDLAAKHDQLILVHTPHLEDKLKGTRLILDVLKSDIALKPERVIIDHVEEHTIQRRARSRASGRASRFIRNPSRTPPRAIDMLEIYGARAHLDELRLRLGRERSAGGAEDRAGNARARLSRREILSMPVLYQNPRRVSCRSARSSRVADWQTDVRFLRSTNLG